MGYLFDADCLEERATWANERARRANEHADSMYWTMRKLEDILRSNGNTMAPDQWETLLDMEPQQLQVWLRVGSRLAKLHWPGAVNDAIRWVEETMNVAAGSSDTGNAVGPAGSPESP